MKTVCMFYNLKHGGKAENRGVENLYTDTISIPGCEKNIRDYCECYLDCPNNGEINGNAYTVVCGSLPVVCYLKMDEVDLSDEEESEE